MTTYAKHFSTKKTSQSEKIPGKDQIKNSAGGYAFAVDDWTRLERFLILGSEGGSYYATERKLTIENAECVMRCAKADIVRTVSTIVRISDEGRAPKNDPAIFALAVCTGVETGSPNQYALSSLNKVCRTATHLFQFLDSVEQFRGHGPALNKALRNWYLTKTPRQVAYQMAKYQQRGGWSHRDVLRLVKPKTDDTAMNLAFGWVTGKRELLGLPADRPIEQKEFDSPLVPLQAMEQAKRATTKDEIIKLIERYDLVRECIPMKWLNEPEVWAALLEKMPLTALIRNLGKMSNVGLLKPLSNETLLVAERLEDKEQLTKARIHPLAVLIALGIYRSGRGLKGSLSWAPDGNIIDALDDAFYLCFGNVVPTGKRLLLGLDISGSMTWNNIAGTYLTPRDAAAAMAMVAVRSEQLVHTMAFSSRSYSGWQESGMAPVSLSRKTRLDDAVSKINGLPAGGTDCALPMLYAAKNDLEVDGFVVYTDSETWAGNIHPCQALQQYRRETGIPAKLIVVGMVSNGFTIADPDDGGMLDCCGFDAAAPVVMNDFLRA